MPGDLIESQWQIALGGTTLLAVGDGMQRELRIARAFSLQPEEGVRAEALDQFARGNVRHVVSFDVHREYESAAAAQAALMTLTKALPTEPADGTLTRGASSETLARAAVTAWDATTDAQFLILTVQITGGLLT